MYKIRFLLPLLLICVLFLPGCGKEAVQPTQAPAAEQTAFTPITPGRLTIAVSPDLAPMEFVTYPSDDSECLLAGFDISLGEYLAAAMELEVQWLPMDFDSCLEAVEEGRADMAISAVAWTATRAEKFSLSIPYSPYKGTADVVVMATDAEALTEIVNTVLSQAESAGCYAQWYTHAKDDAINGYEVSFDSRGQVIS